MNRDDREDEDDELDGDDDVRDEQDEVLERDLDIELYSLVVEYGSCVALSQLQRFLFDFFFRFLLVLV